MDGSGQGFFSSVVGRFRAGQKRRPSAETGEAPFLPSGHVVHSTYTIVERVGRGGMGEVYKATAGSVETRKYALKIVLPEQADNALFSSLLEREADLAKFSHPAVVQYVGRMMTDSFANRLFQYIAMEFVDGPTMLQAAEPRGAAARNLLSAAIPLADALDRLHAVGIFHRDISPGNIILRDAEWSRPVLIDFGIARNNANESVIGEKFAGKRAFAPKERWAGGVVDAETDLYSLGMTLLAAARGSSDRLGKRGADDAPDTEGVQPRLKAVIDRLTAPRPQRFSRGADLLAFMQSADYLALPEPADPTIIENEEEDIVEPPDPPPPPVEKATLIASLARLLRGAGRSLGALSPTQRAGIAVAGVAALVVAVLTFPEEHPTPKRDAGKISERSDGGEGAKATVSGADAGSADPTDTGAEAPPPDPGVRVPTPSQAEIDRLNTDLLYAAFYDEKAGEVRYGALENAKAKAPDNQISRIMNELYRAFVSDSASALTLVSATRERATLDETGGSFWLTNNSADAVNIALQVDPPNGGLSFQGNSKLEAVLPPGKLKVKLTFSGNQKRAPKDGFYVVMVSAWRSDSSVQRGAILFHRQEDTR